MRIGSKTKREVLFEAKVLDKLKNFEVPRIIKNKNQQDISIFQTKQVILYKYIPGKSSPKTNKKILFQVGVLLAKIHIKTKGMHDNYSKKRILSYKSDLLHKDIKKFQKVKNLALKKYLKYIEENIFKYNKLDNLPKGAVHNDFKPDNTILQPNGKIGLIDFDNIYFGPLIVDLASTIVWFCTEKEFKEKDAKIIIESYNKTRKLTPKEKNILQDTIRFVYLRLALKGIEFYVKYQDNKRLIDFVLKMIPKWISIEKSFK